MKYTNTHMNEKLLRDQLFRNNDTYNLMYVWLDCFKKRLNEEIN